MEESYATKIRQPKIALYGEFNAGVLVIEKNGKYGCMYQPRSYIPHNIHLKTIDRQFKPLLMTLNHNGLCKPLKGKTSMSSATLDSLKRFRTGT